MAGKKKLLLVNDDADLVEMMTALLEGAGYEVHSSTTRVFDVVLSTMPDVVLDDCPPGEEKHVLNFIQRIRLHEKTRRIPVVLASSSLRHLEPDLLREKSIHVMIRPYGADELLQSVERALRDTEEIEQKAPKGHK